MTEPLLSALVAFLVSVATVGVVELARLRVVARHRVRNLLGAYDAFRIPDVRNDAAAREELERLDIPDSRAKEMLAVMMAAAVRSWLVSARELEREAPAFLGRKNAVALLSRILAAQAIVDVHAAYETAREEHAVGTPEYSAAVEKLAQIAGSASPERMRRFMALVSE